MKEKEDFFSNLRILLGKKTCSELSRLAYEIERFVSNLALKEIKDTQAWIDETIDMYYQEELDNAIENARNITEYYENKDGDYIEYNKYMIQTWHDEYEPNIDLIIKDFNVETRDSDYDSYTLEWLLEINYRDTGLIDGIKNYQIMAIMALDYIDRFINGDSFFKNNSFNNDKQYQAFWIYIAAKDMKYSLEVETIKLDVQKEIKKKAADARHRENKRMKEIVINKWKSYKNQKLKEGKTPSKNAFAERIFKELQTANKKDSNVKAYSLKTIRTNWLQGI